ncbi:MAG TPA: hypothetical protein VGT98_05505 [Candidatus Elarobacter sp.]|nr:hypothetical protein [Candidatus Elarobacter sp.]HEV2740032.1 hypothetical protein [Candidatus Elarobacter sp.]
MKVLQLAGAAALCGALLLTACAKKTTDQSTSSTTDTTQAAGATTAPDAAATTAPAAGAASGAPVVTATAAAGSTSVSSSSGNGSSAGYIDIPVYPGASEGKDQAMTASGNGTSIAMKVYTSKDDAKTVSEWYKSHLPASWKNSIITVGGQTGGTFVDEHADGDQSVLVTNQSDGTSRIQLTTKHGK